MLQHRLHINSIQINELNICLVSGFWFRTSHQYSVYTYFKVKLLIIWFNVTPAAGKTSQIYKKLRFKKYFYSTGFHMRYWWVNQNKTYKTEVSGGFMWSPKTRLDGARNKFYENMEDVAIGDIVFSFCSTYIKAIGVVTATAESAPKPDFGKAGTGWSNDGWLVFVEYRILEIPIRPKDNMDSIRPNLPEKYSPLQKNGNGLQSVYLAEVPMNMAHELIRLIGDPFAHFSNELFGELAQSETNGAVEVDAILGRTDIGATTKSQLVKSRRGQGVFKANVQLNEKGCRVTGVTETKHLRASHIKPWSTSTDEEKLNGCNGLLLAPHADHLFDSGFVSFLSNGDLLISPQLDIAVLKAWGINQSMNVGLFNEKQAFFLDYHRRFIFKNTSFGSGKSDLLFKLSVCS